MKQHYIIWRASPDKPTYITLVPQQSEDTVWDSEGKIFRPLNQQELIDRAIDHLPRDVAAMQAIADQPEEADEDYFRRADIPETCSRADLPDGFEYIVTTDPLPGRWLSAITIDPKSERWSLDLGRAKKCVEKEVRDRRHRRFQSLDIEISSAIAANDMAKVQRIEKQRQRLRDLTKHPAIQRAKSIDDLEAVDVAGLVDIGAEAERKLNEGEQ